MNNKQQRPKKRIRVSLRDKVLAILRNRADAHQVTFHFADGTTLVQELKDNFLDNKKSFKVIEDLNAIKNDLKALYYEI